LTFVLFYAIFGLPAILMMEGGRVFPSEMIILLAIAASCSSLDSLRRWRDNEGEYIGNLRDSLVQRNYLRKVIFNKYQLTPMGQYALTDFLRKNKIIEEVIITRLQQFGIDARRKQEQTVGKLKKERIKVTQ